MREDGGWAGEAREDDELEDVMAGSSAGEGFDSWATGGFELTGVAVAGVIVDEGGCDDGFDEGDDLVGERGGFVCASSPNKNFFRST